MIDTASQWYYRRRQIVGYNYVIMEVIVHGDKN